MYMYVRGKIHNMIFRDCNNLWSIQSTSRKGKKYAFGVIICLSELSTQDIRHCQAFLFSHFTLIDAHLERLKEAVEEACHYRGNMMASMLTKVTNTCAVCDIYGCSLHAHVCTLLYDDPVPNIDDHYQLKLVHTLRVIKFSWITSFLYMKHQELR